MKRKLKYILPVAAVVLLFTGMWIFRPASRFDRGKIDTRLTSLEEPYQDVRSFYFMDGGSIGIEIVDKNGATVDLAISSELGSGESYKRVFVGAVHCRRPGAAEIVNPAETKLMIQSILQRYSHGNPDVDLCLYFLRGRTRDFLLLQYHRVMGHNITRRYGINDLQNYEQTPPPPR